MPERDVPLVEKLLRLIAVPQKLGFFRAHRREVTVNSSRLLNGFGARSTVHNAHGPGYVGVHDNLKAWYEAVAVYPVGKLLTKKAGQKCRLNGAEHRDT